MMVVRVISLLSLKCQIRKGKLVAWETKEQAGENERGKTVVSEKEEGLKPAAGNTWRIWHWMWEAGLKLVVRNGKIHGGEALNAAATQKAFFFTVWRPEVRNSLSPFIDEESI